MLGHRLATVLSHARPRQFATSIPVQGAALVVCGVAGRTAWALEAPVGVADLAENASANSENVESGFQSAEPSACAIVSALTRLAAIHCFICSFVTGPYCWP